MVILHLGYSGQLVAQALADVLLRFYKPQKKILKGVCKYRIICLGIRVTYKLEEVSPYLLYEECFGMFGMERDNDYKRINLSAFRISIGC